MGAQATVDRDKCIMMRLDDIAVVVFLSDKRTTAKEAESLVPEGFRLLTLEQGAMVWLCSQQFRDELRSRGGVWIGQTGLDSHGPHSIEDDLGFRKVSEEALEQLAPKRRSRHRSGTGRVELSSVAGELSVSASTLQDACLRAAYIIKAADAPTLPPERR